MDVWGKRFLGRGQPEQRPMGRVCLAGLKNSKEIT